MYNYSIYSLVDGERDTDMSRQRAGVSGDDGCDSTCTHSTTPDTSTARYISDGNKRPLILMITAALSFLERAAEKNMWNGIEYSTHSAHGLPSSSSLPIVFQSSSSIVSGHTLPGRGRDGHHLRQCHATRPLVTSTAANASDRASHTRLHPRRCAVNDDPSIHSPLCLFIPSSAPLRQPLSLAAVAGNNIVFGGGLQTVVFVF